MPRKLLPVEPARLLTLSAVARRVPARKAAVIGAVRGGDLRPDFVSDGGLKLFRPARLEKIRRILKPTTARHVTPL